MSSGSFDIESSAKSPVADNFVVAEIRVGSDIAASAENYSGSYYDSHQHLLLQLYPLALTNTYMLDVPSSNRFHMVSSHLLFLSSGAKQLSSIQISELPDEHC